MRKIILTTHWKKVTHYFETKNGLILYLPWQFDIKINLKEMTYTERTDADYNDCKFPTLNDLIKSREISDIKFPYLKIDCYLTEEQSHAPIEDIISFVKNYFKHFGFNVSKDAIEHNYEAWKNDFKSGYLDKENGYHLFSPCGCNPLRFTLTSLHPSATDWQITYTC